MGPHFPKWLQTQNSYVNLDISVAGISNVVPDWFWNMSFGRYLNFSHNQMRGEIPEVSKDLFPKIVDLSHNNFSSPIPLFVFQSEILSISKNMFSGSISYVCKIPSDFFASILDLSDNQLSGKLPNCWKSLTNLIILNLANNHFRGKIPNTIGALYQLQTFHLRNNNIMGKLPSSLKNCTTLRMIDLGENKLTGDIPAWIGTHLTRLAGLSLQSNQFHRKISPTICHLVNIQILDLSINHISGKIPRCLNNFTSLVEKNSSIETIPIGEVFFERYVDNVLVQWKGKAIEYRKLGFLKGIDLSSNMLVGTIPQELSDMKGLIFLNLSRNHLTGNIISSIGQMEMLEWLDLSKNQLSGEIPTGLANLNYLNILDLSYNNLTGKIPIGTQLQSSNPSTNGGNNKLCRRPLAECPQDAPDPSLTDYGKGNNVEEDNGFKTREFYFCMALVSFLDSGLLFLLYFSRTHGDMSISTSSTMKLPNFDSLNSVRNPNMSTLFICCGTTDDWGDAGVDVFS
ncbi:receptor kinase-like protein Xa21 [Olea europaea var. sylvestris]|uniref:receptor kinase-like protein Xa21 n=1 Tax=Olea europaea var. sylvestris TaxID=158386 RepID=UPI000C1D50EB|nr:receptor kinase-like protein Xa21 [Olea europaea var. sylvestris]